jgi:hypothetical protein
MNPEEAQQYQNALRAWARDLSDLHDRLTIWKCLAITLLIALVFCLLEIHGCIPGDGVGWPLP